MAVTLGLAAAGTTAALAINAMMAITAVSVIASTAMGITSGVMQANQAKAQARYQKQVNEMNAQASRAAAQAKIENQRRATKFTHGTQLAKLGGMGALAEGSPLDIMGQTASQSKYDQLVTEYQGEAQMIQFQQKAALNDYEAKMADYNLGLNTTAQVIGGVGKLSSSLLSGVGGLGSAGGSAAKNVGDFTTSGGSVIDVGKDQLSGTMIS